MSDINVNELRSALVTEWTEVMPLLRMSKVSERVIGAMAARIVRLVRERNRFDAGDLGMLFEDLWADYVIAHARLQNEAELSMRLDGILARARALRDELRKDAVDGSGAIRAAYSTRRRSAGFPWR